MDCAREESLFWHHIWVECDRPTSGIVYNIMKKCRSIYHYMLRSLKKKEKQKIKIAISKQIMNTDSKSYWNKVKYTRKNNFNTTSIVDGYVGNVEIANHFQSKFEKLFNSVESSKEQLESLYTCINNRVHHSCDSISIDNCMHCHVITKVDIIEATSHLKSDKCDQDGILLSNNFIHGTDLLYEYLALLFTCMINLDNIIIARQYVSLSTSNYQFGFKAKSSTVLCSTMVNETIQYYLEKGGQSVYLLLLDASKAFDKVSYEMLFQLLLDRNVCPRIIRLLYYMYNNQQCLVKWSSTYSDPFTVSNGVKQGGVISPLLFSIYIDNLFMELKQLGLGCHVGLTYAGAFGYADDIALISPSLYGLKKMISVCENYAREYHITFNLSKTKLICFNVDPSNLAPLFLNSQPVTVVTNEKHLGNYISTDINDRNITSNVCDFTSEVIVLLMIFVHVIV